MDRRTEYVVSTLASMPVLLLAYTFLHEAGHALVAMANGATVESFVVGLDAHVTWSGGTWTDGTTALHAVAGVTLPLLVVAAALLGYRRHVRNVTYHVLHATGAAVVAGSTLPWVAIPALSGLGVAPPAGDDVTHALDAGLPAWAVTVSAMGALVGLVGLMALRGLPQGWWRIVREIRAGSTTTPGSTTNGPTTVGAPPPPPPLPTSADPADLADLANPYAPPPAGWSR